ncbi:hypothetical protein ODU75_01565 [Lactobacillus amylovorus]|uniref:hypothetical protein n=1 Tax=Lactobacillus amylovorus TaxID=1604 RepID=UPI00232B34B2|nr:hypothetical protein [Lactobacillus amylovorus]MDB6265380.1 hypothetical protein [Lactobacillus amylovorus]
MNEKNNNLDIGKVALHIDIEIRKDPLIQYEGYSVDFKNWLIRFYIKTADDNGYIVFDPFCTDRMPMLDSGFNGEREIK